MQTTPIKIDKGRQWSVQNMAASSSVNVSGVVPSGAVSQGIATINAFPDEKKIRELAEQIRQRLSHAHQLKLTASQQQQATPAASMQVHGYIVCPTPP